MDNKISTFINLEEKLTQLNIKLSGDFCILPENIEDAKSSMDFIFTETAIPIKKFLKQNGVEVNMLENPNSNYRQRKSIDFYAPLIFIGYSLLSDNSSLVSVGLNILSNYITDYFKETFGEKKVRIEIVVETTPKKSYKSITYEGSVKGINELNNIIKTLKDE
jgi:metal-dependent HD superfamily phosphatase/phosphodiesterase